MFSADNFFVKILLYFPRIVLVIVDIFTKPWSVCEVKEILPIFLAEEGLFINYFKHGLTATCWILLFIEILRFGAVGSLIISLYLLTALLALECRHSSSSIPLGNIPKNFAIFS
jgi:hypothetical protein